MAKKVIKINALSVSEIRRAQKELEEYKQGIIEKTRLLAKELAELGVKVAEAKISDSPLGKYVTVRTDITEEKAGCKAILIATGETFVSDEYNDFNVLLAIEFGAGIHYNAMPNPKADDLGYGVGTFPGQIHAFQDEGWMYWDEESQKWRHSYGIKATMPMYSADKEIIENVVKTAKTVFGK